MSRLHVHQKEVLPAWLAISSTLRDGVTANLRLKPLLSAYFHCSHPEWTYSEQGRMNHAERSMKMKNNRVYEARD